MIIERVVSEQSESDKRTVEELDCKELMIVKRRLPVESIHSFEELKLKCFDAVAIITTLDHEIIAKASFESFDKAYMAEKRMFSLS